MRPVSDVSPLVVVNRVLEFAARYYTHRQPFYLDYWQVEILAEWWDAEVPLEERIGGASDLSVSLRGALENGTGNTVTLVLNI